MSGIWETLPDELYVIGDIHGDFFALKQALIMTGCVIFPEIKTEEIVYQYGESIELIDGCEYYKDKQIIWNPNKKNCFIVFAGDLVDRCRNVINGSCALVVHDEDCDYQILKLLLELNNQAEKYNSKLIIVLGNHEIMNLEKKFSYVSIKALNSLNRNENITKLIKENKNNLYGIVRVGNFIICHGGINPNFFKENNQYFSNNQETIELYNNHVRNFICDINYSLNYLITNKNSPFWDRTNGLNDSALTDSQCKNIFIDNILNIKGDITHLKIIVAHCPQIINNPKMGINKTFCGSFLNKIWRVDVAMSRAFDSYVSENVLYFRLVELKDRIQNNSIDLDFILNFTQNREPTYNSVQLLYINRGLENIIYGIPSLNYFYNDVFKNDFLLLVLYLLQDIKMYYINYKKVVNTDLTSIIKLIDEIHKELFNKRLNSKLIYRIK
jgi:hypothetical protein